MKLVHPRSLVFGLAGLAAVLGVLTPQSSEAAWRRFSAGGCSASNPNDSDSLRLDNWRYKLSERGYQTMDGHDLQVICPVEDASGFQKPNVDHINVHTYDSTGAGNNYSRAYVCAASPFVSSST